MNALLMHIACEMALEMRHFWECVRCNLELCLSPIVLNFGAHENYLQSLLKCRSCLIPQILTSRPRTGSRICISCKGCRQCKSTLAEKRLNTCKFCGTQFWATIHRRNTCSSALPSVSKGKVHEYSKIFMDLYWALVICYY